MITPELKNFVSESLRQGKNPDEIKNLLKIQGGWSEKDIAEVFNPSSKSSINFIIILIPVIIICLIVGGFIYFKTYQSKSLTLNNQGNNSIDDISPNNTSEKDCGTISDLQMFDPRIGGESKDDPVLKCIGESVINNCINSKAFAPIDPTVGLNSATLQIIKNNNVCYFKYTQEQGKYNLCPVSAVKNLNIDTNQNLTFDEVHINDPIRYAKEIFTYAGMGIIIQSQKDTQTYNNNGCTGDLVTYITDKMNSARTKSIDAAIKANISSTMPEAVMYADSNGSNTNFRDVCKVKLTSFIDSITKMGIKNVTCIDSVDSYAISAPLSTGAYYCAEGDNGYVGEIKTSITGPKCQ